MVEVKLIQGPGGGRFPYSNCLLMEDRGFKLLVDTGCEPHTVGLERVDVLLFTHFHPDHIRGHHRVRAGKVLAPEGEEPYGRLEDLARRFAGERFRNWLEMARLMLDLSTVPRASEYFKPGEDVCFRGWCISTIPARGHLLTHTLLEPPGRYVHLVDIDLTGFGPWYANPESSPTLFLEDIKMASRIEAKTYITSHKEGLYQRGKVLQLLARYASRLFEQAGQVLASLPEVGGGVRPWELVGRGIIYRRYLGGLERIMSYFEGMMIEKLLGMLSFVGCVRETRSGFYRIPCDLDEIREKHVGEILSEG